MQNLPIKYAWYCNNFDGRELKWRRRKKCDVKTQTKCFVNTVEMFAYKQTNSVSVTESRCHAAISFALHYSVCRMWKDAWKYTNIHHSPVYECVQVVEYVVRARHSTITCCCYCCYFVVVVVFLSSLSARNQNQNKTITWRRQQQQRHRTVSWLFVSCLLCFFSLSVLQNHNITLVQACAIHKHTHTHTQIHWRADYTSPVQPKKHESNEEQSVSMRCVPRNLYTSTKMIQKTHANERVCTMAWIKARQTEPMEEACFDVYAS